jgi:hypothetical protein
MITDEELNEIEKRYMERYYLTRAVIRTYREGLKRGDIEYVDEDQSLDDTYITTERHGSFDLATADRLEEEWRTDGFQNQPNGSFVNRTRTRTFPSSTLLQRLVDEIRLLKGSQK